jgi:hypothetical protein
MSHIKSCLVALSLLMFSLTTYAEDDNSYLLNKISLQLHAEQWVTTQTALVRVSVNATVSSQGIEKIQNSVMQHLGQLSQKSTWHIVSLNRQEDKSGLESVQIFIEARLPQNELAALRDKAKSMSNPGEKFAIESVEFTPSEDELKQANAALRTQIYNQAKAEMDSLNKLYPEQKFYIHAVDFMTAPGPMPMTMATSYMKADMASVRSAGSAPLSVGNKQELMAVVVFGSITEPVHKGLTPTI